MRSCQLGFATLLGVLMLSRSAAADARGHEDSRGEDGFYDHGQSAREGAVFTLTNETEGNRVAVFAREDDGSLSAPSFVATEGLGTGDSLGSQGALTLTQDGRFLLTVNAGSNDLSVFRVTPAGLRWHSRVPSLGERPISVTERDHVVYVLHAGGGGSIQGFWLSQRGGLLPILGSHKPLSGEAVAPAQISLSPHANALIVTEKATQNIDVFPLNFWGRAGDARVFRAAGSTPFGFDITRDGEIIVSEAGAGGLSSYALHRANLSLITGPIPDNQRAACWVAVSPDDRFAFTTNAASGNVSSYAVDRDGAITVYAEVAGNVGEGATPLDLDFDTTGEHLYVLDRAGGAIVAFDVEGGTLARIDTVGELPPFSVGLAAR